MVSEENIEFLRAKKARYLVGTPKSQLRKFEAALLEKEGWSQVQPGLEAKLVPHPEGQGEEQFVLCRSQARREKEAAMLARQRERLGEELGKGFPFCLWIPKGMKDYDIELDARYRAKGSVSDYIPRNVQCYVLRV